MPRDTRQGQTLRFLSLLHRYSHTGQGRSFTAPVKTYRATGNSVQAETGSGTRASRGDIRSWCLLSRTNTEWRRAGNRPAPIQPEIHHAQHGAPHQRMIVVQVRLMRIESAPVVGTGDRVPGPVRGLKIAEDDPRILVPVGCVAPDVELALGAPGRGMARAETRDAGRMCD